jgi:glyoxylase-like metal-dependent hydrolase (beta-lactamase superfamily II)
MIHIDVISYQEWSNKSQSIKNANLYPSQHTIEEHMKEILPNIFTFKGLMLGRVYAIKDHDGLTLIDTGMPGVEKKVIQQLEQGGYTPSDVKRIFITHAHFDHLGSLPQLQAITGAEVYVHPIDKPVVEGKEFVVRRPKGLRFPETKVPPTPVHHTYENGDIMPVLGGLHVIHTPGHSPGHVVFWQPERKILFTADLIFRMFNYMTLPWGIFTVDDDSNKQQIKRVLSMIEPDALLFGHGDPILTGANAKLVAFAKRNSII